jgi:predicted ATPase
VVLGYPGSGLADSVRALHDAREIGQAATLMNTLTITGLSHIFCGDYAGAGRLVDELVGLSDEKGAAFWKTVGLLLRGCLFTLTGRSAEAVQIIAAGLAAFRSTGATLFVPGFLSYLAKAYADTGQFESARRCVGEAMKAIGTTGESWFEAEAHRIAGEIELMQSEPDAAQVGVIGGSLWIAEDLGCCASG